MNRVGHKFVFTFILFYNQKEVFDMNNLDEVVQVISVGLVVAGFLLNTNRLLKTIELCKESLTEQALKTRN